MVESGVKLSPLDNPVAADLDQGRRCAYVFCGGDEKWTVIGTEVRFKYGWLGLVLPIVTTAPQDKYRKFSLTKRISVNFHKNI